MDHDLARDGLRTIANARRKTAELRAYRDTGSVVTAWGVVWIVGYAAQQFLPGAAPLVWLAGWAGAIGWTATRPRSRGDMRALATWLVALAFVFTLLLVVRADVRTAAMVFGLVVAASYFALGIWAGARFAVLGAVVLLSACVGWWLTPQWLYLALALGGGLALVLGGLWLRRP